MTNMTTAEARELARIAEAKLDWAKAGELYQYAVDHYPAHKGSQLAIADIARLQKRATGCKEFAESLAACSICGLIEGCHHSDCPNDHDLMDDFNYVGSRHHY